MEKAEFQDFSDTEKEDEVQDFSVTEKEEV
jgi:hypothetical protein